MKLILRLPKHNGQKLYKTTTQKHKNCKRNYKELERIKAIKKYIYIFKKFWLFLERKTNMV